MLAALVLLTPLCLAPQGAPANAPVAKPVPVPANVNPAPSTSKTLVIPKPRPKPPEIPSYKVSLRMKNGRRFVGLVSRDRAFHELVHSGAHHGDAVYKRRDRFTLRYVDGLDGDVELQWFQIARLEVREILDSAGVRAMEDNYSTARVVRQAQADAPAEGAAPESAEGVAPAEPAEAPKADANGEGAAPAGEKKDGEKKDEELPLIKNFAPESGWSPERKKQIEWRRTVVGSFPDAREQKFLDVYDQWLPAYEQWEREAAQKQEKDAAKPKSEPRPLPAPKRDAEKGAREPAKATPKETPKEPAPKEAEKKDGEKKEAEKKDVVKPAGGGS